MKKLLLLIMYVFVGGQVGAQLCSSTKVILIDSIDYSAEVHWQLVFEDTFDADTLDLTTWTLTTTNQGALDGTGPYFTLDNISVSPETFNANYTAAAGVCKLIAKKEKVTKYPVSWNHAIPPLTYDYTSSFINTKERYGWGKYEIRCRVPKGKGLWPSFWLFGQDGNYGNEIDVFEFLNENNVLDQYDAKKLQCWPQMHYHSYYQTIPAERKDYNCGGTYESKTDYSLEYHTYSMIWNRFGMYWYIDDELQQTVYQWYDLLGVGVDEHNIKPAQIVFRNDWFPTHDVLICMELGIESGDSRPYDDTQFPCSMDVDFVRYYKPN